jgi:hypothetical protein
MISRTIGTKRNYLKHEYLRDSIGYKYHECRSCNVRTQFSCIICGFCWSCHWKIEQLAKIPYYFLADTMTNADNGSILVHQWIEFSSVYLSAIRKWDLFISKQWNLQSFAPRCRPFSHNYYARCISHSRRTPYQGSH